MKVRALKKRAGLRLHRAIIRRKWKCACNDFGGGLALEVMGSGALMGSALRQLAHSLVATVGQEFIKGSLLRRPTSVAFSVSCSNAPWRQPIRGPGEAQGRL